jgi:hypothetical protein
LNQLEELSAAAHYLNCSVFDLIERPLVWTKYPAKAAEEKAKARAIKPTTPGGNSWPG